MIAAISSAPTTVIAGRAAPPATARVPGEDPAAEEEHSEGDEVRHAHRERRPIEKDERHDDRKGRSHDQEEDAQGGFEVAPADVRPRRQGRLLDEASAQQLEPVGTGGGRDARRQRAGNERLARNRVRPAAQACEQDAVACPFGDRAHEIHHRIRESPGEVAAERGDHHRAHLLAPGRRHAERPDERHRHQQAEDHLRDALDRIEHACPLLLPDVSHSPPSRWTARVIYDFASSALAVAARAPFELVDGIDRRDPAAQVAFWREC